MSPQEINIELIECFLADRLSKKDRREVEDLLGSDKKFKALFEELSVVIKGVEYSARNELMNKLKKTEKGLPEIQIKPKTVTLKKVKYTLAIAATVALLLGSVYTVLISRHSDAKNDYLTNYYSPYPNIIHPVQRDEDTGMTEEELAYFYYESEQYDLALEKFLELKEDTSVNLENTLFYLANIHMALGNYEQAIENFTNLLNDSLVFANQTRWYLSLCYLEEGNVDSAKRQLEQIMETDNSYNERAMELLDKVRKKK